MTDKEEEIQEGLAAKMASFEGRDYWRMTDIDKEYWLTQAYGSLEYLHSQGVVIKVVGELPYINRGRNKGQNEAQLDMRDMMLKAGYVAVEPLVGCPSCRANPFLCKCPTIDRGSQEEK